MNVKCRVCLLEIQFSLGQQYSVVFYYYNKGNMKVNLTQFSLGKQYSVVFYEREYESEFDSICHSYEITNNQANDYLGTMTHLLITLKAPADCSVQPTLPHVPEWCQPQRLALILVFSTISLFDFFGQLSYSLTKYH